MAKKISKRDVMSPRTAYRGGAILFGLPFLGIGVFYALLGFGVLDIEIDANAPLWVIGCVGLAFAMAGALIVFFGVRGVLHRRRATADEPWFRDYPWDSTGIFDAAARRWVSSVSAVAFLAVFLAPFHWWAFFSGQGPWMVKIGIGFFDLILLFVIGDAVYRILQFLRYGRSRLDFGSFPFHPGGPLRAVFHSHGFPHVHFTLRFVEERFETRGCGENRETRQVNYAHYTAHVERDAGLLETELEVEFLLPDNTEWVNDISGTPVRYWELLVEAEVPGVDFKTTFLLPVYASPTRENVLVGA